MTGPVPPLERQRLVGAELLEVGQDPLGGRQLATGVAAGAGVVPAPAVAPVPHDLALIEAPPLELTLEAEVAALLAQGEEAWSELGREPPLDACDAPHQGESEDPNESPPGGEGAPPAPELQDLDLDRSPTVWEGHNLWLQARRMGTLPTPTLAKDTAQLVPLGKARTAGGAFATPIGWDARQDGKIAKYQMLKRRLTCFIPRLQRMLDSGVDELLHIIFKTPPELRVRLQPHQLPALQKAANEVVENAQRQLGLEVEGGGIPHPTNKAGEWGPDHNVWVPYTPALRARLAEFEREVQKGWWAAAAAVAGLPPTSVRRTIGVSFFSAKGQTEIVAKLAKELRLEPGWAPPKRTRQHPAQPWIALNFFGAWEPLNPPKKPKDLVGYVPLCALPLRVVERARTWDGTSAADLLRPADHRFMQLLEADNQLNDPFRRRAAEVADDLASKGGSRPGSPWLVPVEFTSLLGMDPDVRQRAELAHKFDAGVAGSVRRLRAAHEKVQALPNDLGIEDVMRFQFLAEMDALIENDVVLVEDFVAENPDRWWAGRWLVSALRGEPTALAAEPPVGISALLSSRELKPLIAALENYAASPPPAPPPLLADELEAAA